MSSVLNDQGIMVLNKDQVLYGKVEINGSKVGIGSFPFVIREYLKPDEIWDTIRRNDYSKVSRLTTRRRGGRYTPFLQRCCQHSNVTVAEMLEELDDGFVGVEAHSYRVTGESELFKAIIPYSISVGLPWFAFDDGQPYNRSASMAMFGKRGNQTPLHHDWWHSSMIQMSGTKLVVMCNMFDANDLTSAWEWEQWMEFEPGDPIDTELLLKTESGSFVRLEPGDALYIPPFWYHEVTTISGNNCSLSLRNDTKNYMSLPPLLATSQNNGLRKLTKQKNLPAKEIVEMLHDNQSIFNDGMKEIWKYMFNHTIK